MNRHSVGQRFVVYDDALSPNLFRSLDEEGTSQTLRPAMSSVNQYLDGFVFRSNGPSGMLGPASKVDEEPVAAVARHCLHELLPQGSQREAEYEYSSFYATYPAGSQLSWHDDGRGQAAAFTIYLSEWQANWGGELDLVDCEPLEIPQEDTLEQSLMSAPVNIISILPRPNRAVFLRGGTIHRIRRVDTVAGHHLRRSLSGFITAI